MSSRVITPDGMREMFAQYSGHVWLWLLEISHSSLAQPYRFVDNKTNITYNANAYEAYPFEFTRPDDADGKVPGARLVLDTIDQRLIQTIRSISDQAAVTTTLVRVDPAGVVTPESEAMNFKITGADYGAYTVSLTLGYEGDFLNAKAVKDYFNPSTSPGLF